MKSPADIDKLCNTFPGTRARGPPYRGRQWYTVVLIEADFVMYGMLPDELLKKGYGAYPTQPQLVWTVVLDQ